MNTEYLAINSDKNNCGFTLIELLLALAVFTVVTSLAVPNLASVINSNRFTSQINNFNGSISYARTEAIKRARTVTMTPINALNWAQGWVITIVDNKLQTKIIRKINSFGGNTSLSSHSVLQNIQFNMQGRILNTNSINFMLCNIGKNDVNAWGRFLTISSTGKANIDVKYVCPEQLNN